MMGCMPIWAAYSSQFRTPEYDWTDTDTTTYFVAAKSYLEGTKFSYEDGDFVTYDMGICRNGDKVTFTNLFDSYDGDESMAKHDVPVVGLYDAEAGTITLDVEQIAVNVWDAYDALLYAGVVTEDGTLEPDTELVFEVDPDFTKISATMDFGCRFKYGWVQIYKDFVAVAKTDDEQVQIELLGGLADMGIAYAGMPISKDFSLVNMGGGKSDITITVIEGEDAFSITEYDTTLFPYSAGDFTVEFTPAGEGTYRGKALVEAASGESCTIELRGEGIAPFDYNKIVLNGDFRFETDVDFPFMVVDVEHPIYDADGATTGETETITVARGGTGGAYGLSTLKAFFSVPEGLVGHLTFKGHANNAENLPYLQRSYILIDDDDYFEAEYALTGDFDPKDCDYYLTEGEHFVYFVHLDNLTHKEENCMYIWDLNLEYEEPQESGIEILTPEIFMGYGVIDWVGLVEKKAEIVIRNIGIEQLSVTSVDIDNDAFSVEIPDEEIGLLEEMAIPVYFEATAAGDYAANITIETNVGTVEAEVEAEAFDEPDYSVICDEGQDLVTRYGYCDEYPFVMLNGAAVNATAGRPFADEAFSYFDIFVEIPEGEVGYLHFKGHSWGTPEDSYVEDPYWNFGGIILVRADGNHLMSGFYDNDMEISEQTLIDNDFGAYLLLPEGENQIEFLYEKQGGNVIWGEDCLRIDSFGIEIQGAGVSNIAIDGGARQEFYDISGKRLDGPQKGINIVRTIHADGSSTVQKIILRK